MEAGMGWVGWTEQETYDSSFYAIETAYVGVMKKLKACFGSGETQPTSDPVVPQGKSILAAFRAAAAPK